MKKIRDLMIKDINAEKMAKHSDKHYIQDCQKILDNLDKLDKKTFINTGRIMTAGHLRDRYPDKELQEGTRSVCRYLGGFCIEFIDEKTFSWGWHQDNDIKHVENTLFNFIKEMIDNE